MTAADPMALLCTYLGQLSAITNLVGANIFRPKLPDAADLPEPMPFECIVVRRAGGYTQFRGGTIPIGDPRLDLCCYGGTELDADKVAREVVVALRGLRQRVFAETDASGAPKGRLLWANVEAGPLALIDQDSGWPYALVSAQVAHTEPAVA